MRKIDCETKPEMVKFLLKFVPIRKTNAVLEAGSRKNKVWYENVKVKKRYECEILDGKDYFKWNIKVDWVVGNPPHRDKPGGKNLLWDWIVKTTEIAQKGFAFLFNHRFINLLTPKRLEFLKQKGFYIQKIVIVNDKRWFGRYWFVVFQKKKKDFIRWHLKSF